MNLKRVLYGAAGLMLASAVAFAGQADAAKTKKLSNPAALTEKAPDTFRANFDTSKGPFVVAGSSANRSDQPLRHCRAGSFGRPASR